jgi:hypothetical protein
MSTRRPPSVESKKGERGGTSEGVPPFLHPTPEGWIHWSIGGLLDPDEPMAFVSAIEALEALGAVVVVDTEVTVVGDAPAWVSTVVARWGRFLRHAHQPTRQVWHVYACGDCYFPQLRRAAARRRRCISCSRPGSMFEVVIPWQTPPLRPRRRKRDEAQ